MTREEAIKILKAIRVYECYPKSASEETKEAIDMAIEALSADAVQGWIPCYERLPKTGDSVLVTYSDGEVNIIWSARPKTLVKYEEANNLIFPVAWMPLPKPYREDGESNV